VSDWQRDQVAGTQYSHRTERDDGVTLHLCVYRDGREWFADCEAMGEGGLVSLCGMGPVAKRGKAEAQCHLAVPHALSALAALLVAAPTTAGTSPQGGPR